MCIYVDTQVIVVTGAALAPENDGPQEIVIGLYANHMDNRFPMWLSSNIHIQRLFCWGTYVNFLGTFLSEADAQSY